MKRKYKIIVSGEGNIPLVKEIFRRTKDYLKTKDILWKQYRVRIFVDISS